MGAAMSDLAQRLPQLRDRDRQDRPCRLDAQRVDPQDVHHGDVTGLVAEQQGIQLGVELTGVEATAALFRHLRKVLR
jgi:hypothetical protein